MKFIITESQHKRLLSEQKVYTSQTEYDKAMIIYNKELDKYNKLLKQIEDIKKNSNVKKKVPKKTSPGRKVRSWVALRGSDVATSTVANASQTTVNMGIKTLESIKKPVKPKLKLPVNSPAPPVNNTPIVTPPKKEEPIKTNFSATFGQDGKQETRYFKNFDEWKSFHDKNLDKWGYVSGETNNAESYGRSWLKGTPSDWGL